MSIMLHREWYPSIDEFFKKAVKPAECRLFEWNGLVYMVNSDRTDFKFTGQEVEETHATV